MTSLTVRPFWRSGTEFGGLGRAQPGMGSRVGAKMTSRLPEVVKKSRDTMIDRFKQNFNGFSFMASGPFHCTLVVQD